MGSWCTSSPKENTVSKTATYDANPFTQAVAGNLGTAATNLPGPGAVPLQGIAPFDPAQITAFTGMGNLGVNNPANPLFNSAINMVARGATPLNQPGYVESFYNPMADNVTRQMENIFGQQNRNVTTNAVNAAGGVGADRIAVAQGNLANQQGLAAGQTYANLWNQAVQAAMGNNQLQQAAGSVMGALAPSVLSANQAGYQGMLQAGNQQQQQVQNWLNSIYNQQSGQYQNPYQNVAAMTAALGPIAGALGGTQNGATIYPPVSQLGTYAGLGMLGLGAYNTFGGGDKSQGAGGGSNPAPIASGTQLAEGTPDNTTAARGGAIWDSAPHRAYGGMQPLSTFMPDNADRQRMQQSDMGSQAKTALDYFRTARELGILKNFRNPFSSNKAPTPDSTSTSSPEVAGNNSTAAADAQPGDPMDITPDAANPFGHEAAGEGLSGLGEEAAGFGGEAAGEGLAGLGGEGVADAGLFGGEAAGEGLAAAGGEAAADAGIMGGIGEAAADLGPLLLLAAADGGRVNPWNIGTGYEEGGDVGADDVDDPDSAYNRSLVGGDKRPRGPIISGNLSDYDLAWTDPTTGKAVEIAAGEHLPPRAGEGLPSIITEGPRDVVRGGPRLPAAAMAYGDDGDPDAAPAARPSPPTRAAPGLPPVPSLYSSNPDQPWAARNAGNFGPALMMAGLATMANTGKRDQHGLPMGGGPLGQLGQAIGAGGEEGFKYLDAQRKQHLAEQAAANKAALDRFHAVMQQVPYSQMTMAQKEAAARDERRQDIAERKLEIEQQKADMGNFKFVPGAGPDEDGNIVQGTWRHDSRYGTSEFLPRQFITSPSNVIIPGGAGNIPGTQNVESVRGVDPPLPSSVGNMNGESIALAGTNYANSGKLPPYLSGKAFEAQRAAIMNYGSALLKSRGLTPQEASEMWLLRPRWAGWLMGADGRAAGALGTLVDHLDTARTLMKALNNGDMQLFNTIKNKFEEQFGSPAPTNARLASQIIGTEVMKAIGAAGAGAEKEREAASHVLSLRNSPEQGEGAIDSVQRLAAGQLRTKVRQGKAIDLPEERLKRLVGKRGWEVLGSLDEKKSPTDKDREIGRRNEFFRKKFIEEFGVEP